MANVSMNSLSIISTTPNDNILSRPHSLIWRIFHGTHTMLGGICLIAGSCMYFTEIMRHYSMALDGGGWLFTIGSFFLLLADLQEWWYYRVGCGFDRKYQDAYEMSSKTLFQHSPSSLIDRLKRAEVGTNFFATVCGSALYLAGSILLIPTFEKYVVLGDWLIIIGSAMIFLSATWKIYRASHTNVTDPHNHRFRLANLLNDKITLGIDVSVGLGGVFFFFGVILSLPSLSKDDSIIINTSAALCVVGGILFFIASLLLQFRYYCTHHL
jgi:hypothetical protein